MSQTFLVQNGDVIQTPQGQVAILSSPTATNGINLPQNQKIRQDLSEGLSVEIQPDGFGAGIVNMVGSNFESDDGSSSNIDFALRDRLTSFANRFIALQKRNVSNRPRNEIIAKVSNIETLQSQDDPTTYFWVIEFVTYDGQIQPLRGRVIT